MSPMKSDYNENSASQASSAMKLIPVLQKLAKRLDSKLPDSVALSVCEYGCATGGSSIEPLNAIKEGCKVSKRPLKAAMNDLPGNDWSLHKHSSLWIEVNVILFILSTLNFYVCTRKFIFSND